MKASAWIAIVLGILVVVQWWRQDDLEDQIMVIRQEIGAAEAAASGAAQVRAVAPGGDFPGELGHRAAAGMPRIGRPAPEPLDITSIDRVAELERVVNAQADLIEEMMTRMQVFDQQRTKAAARPWGPEQATGAPDTANAGDYRTAWAPSNADAGVEWIEAAFETSTEVAQLVVRQTSNPGTITKITAVMETGSEVPVWSGEDPSRGQSLADTPFAFPAGIKGSKFKVYLDTSKLPGWEEIDAFQLVGKDGSKQWAKSVNASSTYAGGTASSLGVLTLSEGSAAQTLIYERF